MFSYSASQLASVCNSFSDKIWKTIPSQNAQDKGGVFISPLSITMAMLLTANGCKDITQKQILEVFGVNHISQINEEVRRFMHSMPSLSIANAVFCMPPSQFRPEYITGVQEFYSASAEILRSAPAEQINNWCSEHTNGKIKKIVEDVAGPMVLINAVYFKGSWKYPFPKKDTTRETFTMNSGKYVLCHMMKQNFNHDDKLRYCESNQLQAVCLPYETKAGKRGMEAIVILPSYGMNLDQEKHQLPRFAEILNKIQSSTPLNGYLELPKFEVEFEDNLVESFEQLGVRNLFVPSFDMDPMFLSMPPEGVMVENIIHKTFIQVDEEGTEAAAVTAVIACFGSPSPIIPATRFRMICNRPFYFVICDSQTKSIVFLGRVDCPSSGSDLDNVQTQQLMQQVPNSGQAQQLLQPIPLPKSVHDRLQFHSGLVTKEILVSICNKDGISALNKVTQLITHNLLQEATQEIANAYQIFNFVQSQYQYCFGEPLAHAFYNLACVQSLLLELFLIQCKSRGVGEGCSFGDTVSQVRAMPLFSNFIGHDIPPLISLCSSGEEVLQSRYHAIKQYLRIAIAAGYDDTQHMAEDRDLKVYHELKRLLGDL